MIRADLIVQWWAEGVPHREIAARLGRKNPNVGDLIARLRRAGYDLPPRPQAGPVGDRSVNRATRGRDA